MKKPFFIVIGILYSLAAPAQQKSAPVSEQLAKNAQPLGVTYKTPLFKKPVIQFGEFVLAHSRRSGTSMGTSGFQIYGIGPEKIKGKQKALVKVSDSIGREAEAELIYQEQSKGVKLGENSKMIYEDFADFYAFVYIPATQRHGLMHVHFDGLMPPRIEQPGGTLQMGNERIQIRCNLSTAGKVLGMDIPNGIAYEFVREGQPVAAVSFAQGNRAQVWLSKDLSPDDRLLFSTCVTALLYRERMVEAGSINAQP